MMNKKARNQNILTGEKYGCPRFFQIIRPAILAVIKLRKKPDPIGINKIEEG